MAKLKYVSEDSRTGYAEGTIAELSEEELQTAPFNVKLHRLEPIDDSIRLARAAIDEDKDEVINLLKGFGLSPKRIFAVLGKYPNLVLLHDHADNAGIDPLTDKFLKDNFGKGGDGKKKSNPELPHEDRNPSSSPKSQKEKKVRMAFDGIKIDETKQQGGD